mmetsp:Transcript_23405/g.61483  ORF Transcript_23405/g.61483 Transcript_23405/m.61483 type:complete len:148 (-) Transcript_23405:659-1102(-)
MFQCFSCCCCENDDDVTALAGVNVGRERNDEDQGQTACNGVFDESYPVTCKNEEHPDEHFQFTVTLDRSSGKRMGLAVRTDQTQKLLQIMSVEGGSSAAADWNNAHPDKALQQGDYIISVNSRTEMPSIVLECKKCHMLRIMLQRQR